MKILKLLLRTNNHDWGLGWCGESILDTIGEGVRGHWLPPTTCVHTGLRNRYAKMYMSM